MSDDVRADVIVVGAGIAGALAANGLARKGVDVAVLEAGPPVDRPDAVLRFQLSAARVPESAYEDVSYAPRPTVLEPRGYYVQSGPELFQSTYERRVGGTTWHWLGTALRLVPNDFRLRNAYGRGVDWPITYDELEPWYGRAERAIGVSGVDSLGLGAPRSTPYPMPPIPQSYLDGRFTNAEAKRHGVRVVDSAVAHDVAVTPENVVVRFLTPDGEEHIASGRTLVLAANAIETPKLMLLSRRGTHRTGLGNGNDLVGRHLMDHPTQLSWALAPEPVYPFRGPLSTSGIEVLRDGAFRRRRGAFRIEIGNDGWSWPKGDPTVQAVAEASSTLGPDGLRSLGKRLARQIRVASLVEPLRDRENRVQPSEKRDSLGIPRPEISYRTGGFARAGLAEARRVHERLFAAIGATEVEHWNGPQGAGHIMGTCPMGEDPRTSVVDRDLRVHGHRNCFVLGSAVFPTVGTANPTLTIAALSLRAVDE